MLLQFNPINDDLYEILEQLYGELFDAFGFSITAYLATRPMHLSGQRPDAWQLSKEVAS